MLRNNLGPSLGLAEKPLVGVGGEPHTEHAHAACGVLALARPFDAPREGSDLPVPTLLKMPGEHMKAMCAVGVCVPGAECGQVRVEHAAVVHPDVDSTTHDPYLWAMAKQHQKEPDHKHERLSCPQQQSLYENQSHLPSP